MADIQFRVDAVLGDTTQLQQQIQGLQTNLTLTINNTQALQSIQQVQQRVDALRQSMQGLNLGNLGGGIGGGATGGSSGGSGQSGYILNAQQTFQTSQQAASNIQSVINNLNSQIDGTVRGLRLCTDETGKIVGGTAQITQGAATWTRNIEQARDANGQIIEGQYRLTEQGRVIVDNSNKQNGNLLQQIKLQFKQYAIYYAVSTIIQTIAENISGCINYVKDLDKAMTNVRVVTMDSQEATEDLLETYNEIGQKFGASTVDVAEGAVDWLRQGYSTEETNTLVTDSTILSKLALIDTAEATEYLTSAMKGYKLEASEAIGVIDQLVSIDLKAATSAGDMAEAMSRTANMAKTTGFAMNELLGVIATMSEVTQNSAGVVGNSVKTMLSRMSNVAAGKDVDDEGESINDVEKTLNRIGIALRTSENEWRDYYEVLDEIYQKWDTLTGVDKSQVTTALGGTRQRENVLVILENWDKVKEYAQVGAEASGTAMDKYGIVLESVEAKQAQLTAKTEEFYSNVLNSGFIKSLLDIGKTFMDVMNLGDGLVGKIILLTSVFALLNTVIISNSLAGLREIFVSLGRSIKNVIMAIPNLITGLNSARVAQEGLNAAQRANIWIAVAEIAVMAIWGITSAINKQKEETQEAIDKVEEMGKAFAETQKTVAENIDTLSTPSDDNTYSSLSEEFAKLTEGVDKFGNNISLTNEEYNRYKEICEIICGINPELTEGYDSVTNAVGNNASAIQELIELQQEKLRLDAEELVSEENLNTKLKKVQKSYKELKTERDDAVNSSPVSYNAAKEISKLLDENGVAKAVAGGNEIDFDEYDAFQILGIGDYWTNYIRTPDSSKVASAILVYYDEIIENIKDGKDGIYHAYAGDGSVSVDGGTISEIIDILNDEVKSYNKEVEDAKNKLDEGSKALVSTYLAVPQSIEKYADLSDGAKSYITEWIKNSKIFKIDDKTEEEEVKEAKQKIIDMVNSIANSNYPVVLSDGTEVIGQSLFTKLFEIDNNASELTVEEYRKQIEEVLRHIVAMVNGIDAKDVTEKQIVEMGDIFGFKMVTDGKKGIPWDVNLKRDLPDALDTLREEIQAKIDSGEYKQKDLEIILSASARIDAKTTIEGVDDIVAQAKTEFDSLGDVLNEYVANLDSLSKGYKTLSEAQEEYNEYGGISAGTMQDIIDNGLLEYLEEENGKLVFNTEKLQENATEKRNEAIASLQAGLASDIYKLAVEGVSDAEKAAKENSDTAKSSMTEMADAFANNSGKILTAAAAMDIYNQATGDETGLDDKQQQLQSLVDTYNKSLAAMNEMDVTISSGKSSKSSKSSKEWWETALSDLKDDLEYNSISMDAYISGIENILGKLQKGSDAWKEVNAELQQAKLDQIENQFDRGEITISQYIAKLEALRNTYNKNSEGYKELTQTINEAKADKFADEYERGQISLAQYIARLTELRNAYKTNSEEWKKFNDLIRETALDEFIKGLEESVDEIERAISKLGEINTNKEQAEYAGLLVKQYKQVQSNISAVQTKLKDVNLISKEREELQEKLNDLLKDEVDIRDEIEDSVRTYYENQKEQAEQQAELHKKQLLYQKELELYGNQGKELYEYYANQEIDALQAIIDKKEEEREAQDKLNEREELQNNLLEARIKLQEALNNKTTKILKKQADGTWQYEYSSNMTDVKSAQDAVKDAEKALEDFDYEQTIDELQGKIDELQGTMDDLADQYEDAEFWADREYEQTMNAISEVYGDIDALVEKWMASYNKDTKTLTDAYVKLTDSNIKLEDAILKLEKAIKSQYETVGKKNNVNAKNDVTSFDTGGTIQGDGFAFVHDKERVLTASQNIYFEQLVSKLPELLKLVDITKVNGGIGNYIADLRGNVDKTLSTVISKVECIFPNITTTEGLQRAILELPRLALQQK